MPVRSPASHPCLYVCVCVCVCVCVQRARQCRQEKEHTHPKKEETACVGEEEERETASQMNQPTNQVKQRAYVCACEEELRKKKEETERKEGC